MSNDEEESAASSPITTFIMNPILFPGQIEPYEKQVNEKLKDPNLLEWISSVLSNRIVGEDLNKLTVFLIALSYKTDDPQGVIFTGPPAIGKSHLARNVLRLFPNVINLTRITRAVLDRLEVDFSNYILYISELGGQEQATPTMRVMLSEGELRLATTTMENGKILPKVIETTGKPVYVTTTTQMIVERQLASRTWMLNLDVTKEQTQHIHRYQARKAASVNHDEYSEKEMVLRCLLYKLKPYKIIIPYAEKLSEMFPFGEIQARRDFLRLLALIKCVALIFQKQRALVKSKGEEVLLANLMDLAYAIKLVKPILFTTLYALPKKAFEVLDIFKNSESLECTVKDVARQVDLSQNRTRTIMNGLVDRAFLFKDDSRRPHKYSWTEKSLEEPKIVTVLSTVISKEFFSPEEFDFWYDTQQCTSSEASGDIYDTYILPHTPLVLENAHSTSIPLKTTVSNQNTPEIVTIDETVTIPKTSMKVAKLPIDKLYSNKPVKNELSDFNIVKCVWLDDPSFGKCANCKDTGTLPYQVENVKKEFGFVCNRCGEFFLEVGKRNIA